MSSLLRPFRWITSVSLAGLVLLAAVLAVASWRVSIAGPLPSDDPAQITGGDTEEGARTYQSRCTGCHSLDANRIGPRHRGVYGRVAGSLPDFDYSSALTQSDIVWNDETLNAWLINPEDLIPGQAMGFRLNDAQARADVIAYLRRESGK